MSRGSFIDSGSFAVSPKTKQAIDARRICVLKFALMVEPPAQLSVMPAYWRTLYVALRPLLYGFLAALDGYFEIESKRTKLTIEHR